MFDIDDWDQKDIVLDMGEHAVVIHAIPPDSFQVSFQGLSMDARIFAIHQVFVDPL